MYEFTCHMLLPLLKFSEQNHKKSNITEHSFAIKAGSEDAHIYGLYCCRLPNLNISPALKKYATCSQKIRKLAGSPESNLSAYHVEMRTIWKVKQSNACDLIA